MSCSFVNCYPMISILYTKPDDLRDFLIIGPEKSYFIPLYITETNQAWTNENESWR